MTPPKHLNAEGRIQNAESGFRWRDADGGNLLRHPPSLSSFAKATEDRKLRWTRGFRLRQDFHLRQGYGGRDGGRDGGQVGGQRDGRAPKKSQMIGAPQLSRATALDKTKGGLTILVCVRP